LPQAGGLRYCTAAAFASLKKYATHFFNLGLAETKAKEAAHAVAGVNSEKYLLNIFSLQRLINCRPYRSIQMHFRRPQKNSVKKFTE